MTTMLRRSQALLFALPLLARPAWAEPEIVKVASVAPADTPWSELLDRIKERVNAGARDKLKMRPFFGGKLGGEKETIRETREGRIQMWGGSTAALATIVPELYALEAPFLFESSEEADFVLDNYLREPARKLLEEKGFVLYQWAENGWHGIATKTKCVKTPADLMGLKIRSQEAQIHLDTFKALGANPVEISVPEVLPALNQGVVDGFSNTPLFTFAVSWYQGIKFYTVTNHVYQPAALVYSKKWFDKQPKEVQTLLMSSPADDEKFGRKGVRELQGPLLDNFRNSQIEVCELTSDQRDSFKKATSKIFETYRKKSGDSGKPIFQAIAKGKAAWAEKQKPGK
ncbi:MAG: TRAP transporter substrate-binding protein [Deltaproteobacteria bacterium]|nr:TRAP transporter substrate-binding protein [Deltaproteobacteria bacterium]